MNKMLWIHSCWAVAAVSAFTLGWQRGGTWIDSNPDLVNRTNSSASTRFQGDTGSDIHNTRSGTKKDHPDSKLEGLFGKIISGSGSLEKLAEQALRDPNPITRRLAFSRLLEALTPENAEDIRAQLVTLGADDDQWRDFQYSWGAIAGKTAFDHASQSKERDLASTMTGWAAANPSEALAMLDNLPEGVAGQKDELTASIIAGLSHRDAAMATDLVLKLGREGNANAGKLMEIVAKENLRTLGAEQASLWAEALPDGPLKGTAIGRIAESYANKDPQAAAKWAERFAGKDYASGAIEEIGGSWAEKDPLAAVGWLEKLPASSGQAAGLTRAFGDWEDSDPAAAGQYLLAMPNSTQRDSAISGFAMGYAWQNPQLAIAWAQDIRDPALRNTSLIRAGFAYYRRDPTSAQAWLQNSGLPAEAQQQIINGRR